MDGFDVFFASGQKEIHFLNKFNEIDDLKETNKEDICWYYYYLWNKMKGFEQKLFAVVRTRDCKTCLFQKEFDNW